MIYTRRNGRLASSFVALVCWLAIGPVCVNAQEKSAADVSPYVDARGNISLPDSFETGFLHLGTISVAPKKGEDVSELHSTYTRMEDLKAFQELGHFPDGAVLVKEVRAAKGEELSTGHARFASDVKVWFVMVKGSKARFKDNDLWGDGWGWALFKGPDRKTQIATDYRSDCRTCHVPAKETDWIYTQCYPALKRMRQEAPDSKNSSSTEGTPKKDPVAQFPRWQEVGHLTGDVKKGREYFDSKLLNSSLTCGACHSFHERDTMKIDGDGFRRAGFPIFAAVHRTNIKNSGTGIAALGADVCVVHFMKGDKEGMSAQELADMERFLHSGGDSDHPTAKNVDYAALKWTIPDKLDGGDKARGGEIVLKACITCHTVGMKGARIVDAGPLTAGSYKPAGLKKLALRIRNPEYKNNDEMPGYSDLRLSNEELVDILAWFTTK